MMKQEGDPEKEAEKFLTQAQDLMEWGLVGNYRFNVSPEMCENLDILAQEQLGNE